MADNTIDSLNIQVSSSTTKAVTALENLEKSLGRVQNAFKTLNNSGIRNYTRDINRLSVAFQSFNRTKIDASNFQTFNKQLKNLGNVNPGAKLDTLVNDTLPQLNDGLKDLNTTMHSMGGLNLKNTGLNNVINSLSRLAKSDISSFDISVFAEITRSVGTLASMPDVSGSINRFVSSLARLANAGSRTADVSKSLPALGAHLRNVTLSFSSLSSIDVSVNTFVQSIARLASAGKKTSETASNLENLSDETLKFFKVMQNAPHISENTLRMTEALSRLASSGGNVGKSTNTVSSSLNKLSKFTSKASGVVKKGVSKMWSYLRTLGSSAKHVNKLSLSFGKLAKSAVALTSIGGIFYGLTNGIKSAVDIGSDITEVENVVDVAFGNMAQVAYDFASTAKEQFGLSELAAKQYSGTMMAMLKSSDIADESAAKMSITLAGLAGDLASFYNLETDDAFEKIRAGIAGTVAPLRQLGISMTVANLEQYAMTQGITKSYREMTQAEKTMLRYNYLMSVTTQQQGDFARTAHTWANQVRLLKLNFASLSGVIGQGLIAAILPAVKALNYLMSKLMQAAKVFRNFMYTLTGYNGEGAQSGIVNDLTGIGDVADDLGDLGSSGDDASSGLSDASDAAKELKKSLSVLAFDQLNQLSDAAKNASDSLGDTGLGGVGVGGFDDLGFENVLTDISTITKSDAVEKINEWAERIRLAFLNHQWSQLGYVIADGINDGMQSIYNVINWENVGPKINGFIHAFSQTFNSLVNYLDFALIGRTIGAGVNTIVNTLNGFARNIQWQSIGSQLANGVNGLTSEIDWKAVGHMLGNGFMIPWDMLHGFVKDLNSAEIGRSLGKAVKGIFDRIDFRMIGSTFATGVNKVFDILRNFNETFTKDDWNQLAEDIASGFNNMINGIEWSENGEELNTFLTNFVGALKKASENTDWEQFGRSVGTFLSEIDWTYHLLKLVGILWDVLSGIWQGLGDTAAGKFIEGIIKFKVGMQLLPFVDSITKFFTGTTVTERLTNSARLLFSKAFGTGASQAAETLTGAGEAAANAGKKFSLLSGTAGGTFGLLALGTVGTVKLVHSLASLTEILQGGNGNLTQMGATLKDLAGNLQMSSQLTAEQKQEIDALVESLENEGASADEMALAAVQRLKEFGISTTDFMNLVADAGFQSSKTSEDIDILAKHAEELGLGFYESSQLINLSALDTETAFGGMRDALREMSVENSDVNILLGVLNDILGTELAKSTPNAQAAFEAIVTELQYAGVPVEDFIEILGTNYPEALVLMEEVTTTSMEKVSSAAQDGFESASGTVVDEADAMKTAVEEDMQAIDTSVADATGNVASNTEDNFGASYDSLFANLSNMDEKTKTMMNNVLTTVQSKWSSVLINTNQIWEKASLKVATELTKMNKSTTVTTNLIASKFSNLGTEIQNNIGSLYDVGRNIANSFKNGFTSVHIPTPHIYRSSWTRHYTNAERTSWYSVPNYSVSWYEHGGLFNQASVIGVGEAGREAVLPLENRSTMKMIADSILSNAPTSSFDSTEMMNAVAAGVSMAMMNNMRDSYSDRPIEVVTYLDGREIARAVNKANRKFDYAMNP